MAAICSLIAIASVLVSLASSADPPYGKLSLSGTQLVGSNGNAVQLRGISFYWSQWDNEWWTADVVKGLACSWNANVIRAPLAVESSLGGYLTGGSTATTQLNKLYTVVDAAIANGIYVVIDWHSGTSNTNEAIKFFSAISNKYKNVPNVLYETLNEPDYVYDWNALRNYHMAVIKAIRANDANAIIICGTPRMSSGIDSNVIANPIKGFNNIMYTLHWYPNGAAWQEAQRQSILTGNKMGLATFITEYGVAWVKQPVNSTESNLWWNFLDKYKISYINWHVNSIPENWSTHNSDTKSSQIASDSSLTASGKFVKAKMTSVNNDVRCFNGNGTKSSQIASDSSLTASGKFVKAKLTSVNNGVHCF